MSPEEKVDVRSRRVSQCISALLQRGVDPGDKRFDHFFGYLKAPVLTAKFFDAIVVHYRSVVPSQSLPHVMVVSHGVFQGLVSNAGGFAVPFVATVREGQPTVGEWPDPPGRVGQSMWWTPAVFIHTRGDRVVLLGNSYPQPQSEPYQEYIIGEDVPPPVT